MREISFLKSSVLLILSNLMTGMLGFVFSITLSRELGAEGMGLYGLIMPVNRLFMCLICGGILTAISKVTAEYHAKLQYRNLRRSIRTTLAFNMIWSILFGLLLLTLSYPISAWVIKDMRTLYAIRVICPMLMFMALSNTLKGYFYGISNIGVPAVIDILEKGMRILVILFIFGADSFSSVSEKVTAAFVAVCAGEFMSLTLLYLYYRLDVKKFAHTGEKTERRIQLMSSILVISLPLCLNDLISSVLTSVATLMIPRRLAAAGINHENALALIGKFAGMSMQIVFFPAIIIGSISILLIPDLSRSISRRNYDAMEKRVSSVLKISFLLGLGVLALCSVSADRLGMWLFNRSDLGAYIKFAAWSAPLAYVGTTTYAILNGLGKQKVILKNSTIISVVEIALLFFLIGIPAVNIYGMGVAMLLTSVLSLVMNMAEIKKSIEIRIPMAHILGCLLAAVIFIVLL